MTRGRVPRYQTGVAIQFDPVTVQDTAQDTVQEPVSTLALSDDDIEGQVPSQLVQIMQKYPHLKLRIEMYVASGSGNPPRRARRSTVPFLG